MKILPCVSIVVLMGCGGVTPAVSAQNSQASMTAPMAANAQVKTFAAKIRAQQQKERKELEALRVNASATAGQAHSMKPMPIDHLEKSAGREFDRMFLSMMRDHHRDAVSMSREANLTAAPVKGFAQRTAANQSKEIKEIDALLKRLG